MNAVRFDETAVADFAARFADYWHAPTPERLSLVLADRVRLVAPMTPVTETLAGGQAGLRRTVRADPGPER
jgi:hypothetical protein